MEFSNNASRSVCRTIFTDKDFNVEQRFLGENTFHSLCNIFIVIVGHQDDAYEWSGAQIACLVCLIGGSHWRFLTWVPALRKLIDHHCLLPLPHCDLMFSPI